jgi:hypothetical protein
MTSEVSERPDDRPGLHGADLAALLGATVTVLLTLAFNPGAWGPIATIVGLLLFVMLLAFYWPRRPRSNQKWSWHGRLAKLKSVAYPETRRKLLKRENVETVFAWKKWEPFCVGFALSTVMGFVIAIAAAQTIQSVWFGDDSPSLCRSVAVAQATTAVRDLSNISIAEIRAVVPPGGLSRL